mgnify:CR=1 FL=1
MEKKTLALVPNFMSTMEFPNYTWEIIYATHLRYARTSNLPENNIVYINLSFGGSVEHVNLSVHDRHVTPSTTPNGDEIGNMDVVIIHVLSFSHVMTNIQTQKQIEQLKIYFMHMFININIIESVIFSLWDLFIIAINIQLMGITCLYVKSKKAHHEILKYGIKPC